MTRVYVIQAGRTTWDEQSRLESAAGAPLTDKGLEAVRGAADDMPEAEIKAVYACTTGEAERQAAELVARMLHVKVRNNSKLHELDYGLWQGLTVGEIKHSQPRAYRQWTKVPASVRPPEGETVQEAQDRLRAAVKAILKRHKNGAALLVLRPVVMGLLKCLTEQADLAALWQHVDPSFSWGCLEMDVESL